MHKHLAAASAPLMAFWRLAVPSLLYLLLTTATPAHAEPSACFPQGAPILELRVTPGEMAGPGRVLQIALHPNDCVSIRMPDHYRRRGEYVVALSGAERSELEALQRNLAAQPYDQQRMLDEAALLEVARSAGGSTERFAVLDADHYALTLQGADRIATRVEALAVFQYAERYPEIASLDALHDLISRLIAISAREDLTAIAKSAVAAEVPQ